MSRKSIRNNRHDHNHRWWDIKQSFIIEVNIYYIFVQTQELIISRIALGTVQFGLDYGINNSQGQVSLMDVEAIINICQEEGIDTLDTAYSYGESEVAIGKNDLDSFKIISKFPPNLSSNIVELFNKSLAGLNLSSMYGYMLHDISSYKNNRSIWNELSVLVDNKKVQKIGCSLYSPQDLELLLEDDVPLSLVQVPFNLFDRKFEQYFEDLKSRNIEIHVRSSFLQGLFFRPLKSVPTHFKDVIPKLEFLDNFKHSNNMSTIELCLGYVLNNKNIDKVVIGVDSPSQLQANIKAIRNIPQNIEWSDLDEVQVMNESIINPSLWKI